MKKLITAIVVSAFAFIGTAVNADARPWYERGHPSPNYSNGYHHNGYHQQRVTYTQRYIAGYDYHGRPIYRFRTVVASGNSHQNHCDTGYSNGYNRGHYTSRGNYGHHNRYGNHRSSGGRVSFSFRR